ncbi:DUF6782 family putative metallopeptidase [Tropicimonas sediminicola]|uniref:DUF6782 domain-containing protein n=1 Tax=Tropicimonas sediminicola TaxID=1031541 RepID=A0A239FVA7_9RHOB|nr:DUF6782 family putative metallopeptidase [Tropicimonas sediminicola]SNS60730.1 hypothetical protein SAMN05421757_102848 [Tropicimonas sediminicola]
MSWISRLAGIALACSSTHAIADVVGGHQVVCLQAPYDRAMTDHEARIQALAAWLRTALARHPDLLFSLEESAPRICLAEKIFGAEGYFDVDGNAIVLRESLSPDMMRAVAIHEVRHLHQVHSGTCPEPDNSMKAVARMTLALEADASAISLVVGWSLREAGAPGVWDALAAWPTHSDLAAAYERAMTETGDPMHAAAQAFAQWYVSDWRRQSYYLAACSDYLDRQDESHSLPRYGALASDFLESICRLPDGRPYPCEEPEIGTR